MDKIARLRMTQYHDRETSRFLAVAGLCYGLVYSIVFGLTTWGYDAMALARSNAEMAWGKLGLGLPLVLLLGGLAGYVAGRRAQAGLWIAVFGVLGVVAGLIAGAMPFGGQSLLTWIAESRLRGTPVYPYGPAGIARMWFAAAINGAVGTGAGLLGHVLTEMAWNRAPNVGKLDIRTLAVILWCVPLAVLPGIATDDNVNSDLRAGLTATHRGLAAPALGEDAPGGVEAYREQFTDSYVLHLVSVDLETQTSSVVDAEFDNGVVARCTVFGDSITGCPPISTQFHTWMDALIQDALDNSGEVRIAEYANRLVVDPGTVDWLATQSARMSDDYEIYRETQRGGHVIMSARFTTPFVLTCQFWGAAPVTLDSCRLQ
ncbi:MAG: hypothetical protein GX620_13770 [Chloroflexi bacterium]|nr:hypothetical protein [Chloroflexota bacterium]